MSTFVAASFLTEYMIFLAKIGTLALVPVLFLGGLLKGKLSSGEGSLEVKDLNKEVKQLASPLKDKLLPPKKGAKKKKAKKTEEPEDRKKVIVLDYKGDIMASQNEGLSREIDAIIHNTKALDKIEEVVIRLESPGGWATAYGLGASLIKSLRDKGVRVVVTVDKVAASGGYMMACTADKIVAAEHAIVGSIGVIIGGFNFHKLLQKVGVDFEKFMGGAKKSPFDGFSEVKEGDRKIMEEKIEDSHRMFSDFVSTERGRVVENFKIEDVNDGDHWYAKDTVEKELGLVDEVMTSDDYLRTKRPDFDLIHIEYKAPEEPIAKKLKDRFHQALSFTFMPR